MYIKIIQVEEKKNVVDVKTTIISYYGQILGKLRKRISILNNYPNRAVVKSIKNIKSIIKNNDEIIKQSLLCYWNSQLLILEWLNERVSEDKFCVVCFFPFTIIIMIIYNIINN